MKLEKYMGIYIYIITSLYDIIFTFINRKELNMKKLIISIVTCLMIVTGTISAVGALSIEDSGNNETRELLLQDNIVKNTDDNVRINTPLLDYFPFIYSTEKDREWFNENVIGKGDYKEGYLYAKERETNIVRQLVNQPVSKLREA